MQIDCNHVSVFVCVFLILQYSLYNSELNTYSDMLSDIQSNKVNYNTYHFLFVITFGYIIVGLFLYRYIIFPKKTYIEGFIFISIAYLFWEMAIYLSFDKAPKYISVLLYDTFVVGGIGMLAAMFIFNNYYSILKSYIVPLCILTIASMAWFQYQCYKYNPDLSKLTVAHSLGLTR